MKSNEKHRMKTWLIVAAVFVVVGFGGGRAGAQEWVTIKDDDGTADEGRGQVTSDYGVLRKDLICVESADSNTSN